MGDFNLTLDVELDRLNTYSNNNRSAEVVKELMKTYYLEDVWRSRNVNEQQYSWLKLNKVESKGSRIDLCLSSVGLSIENIIFFPSSHTDHRAIYVSLKTNQIKRGRGYWKFNNSLLRNTDFLDYMNRNLQRDLDSLTQSDPISRWSFLKRSATKAIQNFSRILSNDKKIIISQLLEKIDDLQSCMPLAQDQCKILIDSQNDLDDLQNEYIRGVIFRTKMQWYMEGEKCTRYFLNLEKAKYNSKQCTTLLHDDEIITDQDVILEKQFDFYSNLYKADKEVEFKLENNTDIWVPVEIRKSQSEQFSQSEIDIAVMKLANKKTPGNDGLSADFYKVFWKYLKIPFKEIIVFAYEHKIMPETSMNGVLNLIPKSGKDTRLLKNLCPITLLNTDYKIIEKMLSNHLKVVLPKIINSDQTGFMTGRNISTNIRKTLDLIDYCKRKNIEALLLNCDFHKCFDRVSFSCVKGALHYFKFSPYIIKWMEILYSNFSICIQNAGNFSNRIQVERSIHQGGCCSAEIFLVCAETLAIMLRSSDIKAIEMDGIVQFLNQFADDLSAASPYEQENLNNILAVFDKFYHNSGFHLNYDKTMIYQLGSLRNTNAKLYTQKPISWTNDPMNILGIIITDDHDKLIELNYAPLLPKIKLILDRWRRRPLSLMGKICIVNTLIASLFIYKIRVLPNIPERLIKNIENLIVDFLWEGKNPR